MTLSRSILIVDDDAYAIQTIFYDLAARGFAVRHAMKIPRFRGHPKWRENAPGVDHGEEEATTEAASVHAGVQGRGSSALQGRRPDRHAGRGRLGSNRDRAA